MRELFTVLVTLIIVSCGKQKNERPAPTPEETQEAVEKIEGELANAADSFDEIFEGIVTPEETEGESANAGGSSGEAREGIVIPGETSTTTRDGESANAGGSSGEAREGILIPGETSTTTRDGESAGTSDLRVFHFDGMPDNNWCEEYKFKGDEFEEHNGLTEGPCPAKGELSYNLMGTNEIASYTSLGTCASSDNEALTTIYYDRRIKAIDFGGIRSYTEEWFLVGEAKRDCVEKEGTWNPND